MVEVILKIHILAGALSLLMGLGVFLLHKGDKRHILIGNIYAVAMLTVFITSFYVSMIKGNLFLLLIGFFSFYLVHTGMTINRFRKTLKVNMLDKVFTILYGLSFLAMPVYGLLGFFSGYKAMGIILMVFGVIGLMLVKNAFRYYFLAHMPEQNSFIREHIGRMTGSYIAAFTAFAVNNVHFLPPVVIWIAPTVIGIFVINYFSRPYRSN